METKVWIDFLRSPAGVPEMDEVGQGGLLMAGYWFETQHNCEAYRISILRLYLPAIFSLSEDEKIKKKNGSLAWTCLTNQILGLIFL